MIRLYTYDYLKDLSNIYLDPRVMFRAGVLNDGLDKRDIEIIEIIDGAKYIGDNNIKSRFGQLTSVKNISTGAKIALNLKWALKHNKFDKMIDISGCGDNVYPILLEEIGNKDISLCTCNTAVDCDIDAEIILNDTHKFDNFTAIMLNGSVSNEIDD